MISVSELLKMMINIGDLVYRGERNGIVVSCVAHWYYVYWFNQRHFYIDTLGEWQIGKIEDLKGDDNEK